MEVPFMVLAQSVRLRGHRILSPRKHFEPPKPPPRTYSYGTYTPARNGNMENSEYRFFEGSEYDTSSFWRCRACGMGNWQAPGPYGDEPVRRREHLRTHTCAKKLCAAYRLLLPTRECVVCGRHTKKTHWGLPMCDDPECERKFKYNTVAPDRLANALKEVSKRAEFKEAGNAEVHAGTHPQVGPPHGTGDWDPSGRFFWGDSD